MATTDAKAPTIRNPGTSPTTRHKLFVNIPVSGLQRSIEFFESLGFVFNPDPAIDRVSCPVGPG